MGLQPTFRLPKHCGSLGRQTRQPSFQPAFRLHFSKFAAHLRGSGAVASQIDHALAAVTPEAQLEEGSAPPTVLD
jgi:hypothetical protein